MRARLAVIGSLISMGVALGGMSASAYEPLTAEAWMTLRAQGFVRPDGTVKNARNDLLQTFWRVDVDGSGVSRSDYVLQGKLDAAALRSGYIMRWLSMDLDGNGAVTRAELEAYFGKKAREPLRSHGIFLEPTPEQVARTVDKLVGSKLEIDRNGDQVITFSELLSAADKGLRKRPRRNQRDPSRIPLSLDLNGDQVVSLEEFSTVAERVLERIDADRNGIFSASEVGVLRDEIAKLRKAERAAKQARQRESGQRQLVEACGFPAASPSAKIVLLSTSRGRSLSTVGLGGDDVVVSVANAWIEPGTGPLYVVLTSTEAMIWRFTGATDRIEVIAATTPRRRPDQVPLTGIVGVKDDRVHIASRRDCLRSFTNAEGGKAAKAKARVKALVGRPPDSTLAAATVSTVSLPGGIFDAAAEYRNAKSWPDKGAGSMLRQDLRRLYPGGLVDIDPTKVVSRAKAAPYAVLPAQAGLARLLDEGALEVIGTTQVIRFKGLQFFTSGLGDNIVLPGDRKAEVIDWPSDFLILKKIRFPGGLTGSGPVQFQLAPGVPEPDGDPGRTCVRYQATGEPVAGNPHCR